MLTEGHSCNQDWVTADVGGGPQKLDNVISYESGHVI